jgi:hypothetical protein
MGVGDYRFYTAQSAMGSSLRKSSQKASVAEPPMSMPSTSYLPSLLTPHCDGDGLGDDAWMTRQSLLGHPPGFEEAGELVALCSFGIHNSTVSARVSQLRSDSRCVR